MGAGAGPQLRLVLRGRARQYAGNGGWRGKTKDRANGGNGRRRGGSSSACIGNTKRCWHTFAVPHALAKAITVAAAAAAAETAAGGLNKKEAAEAARSATTTRNTNGSSA